MLIEIFTDGRVLIDGQFMGPSCRGEAVLRDYLVNPHVFHQKQPQKKTA